jgi:hypothetical protein
VGHALEEIEMGVIGGLVIGFIVGVAAGVFILGLFQMIRNGDDIEFLLEDRRKAERRRSEYDHFKPLER